MKRLILASGSPRRKDLLGELGYDFEVVPSPAEELHCADMAMTSLCELNGKLKAQAVAEQYPDAIVLGGDTLVYLDEQPIGKPKDEADAFAMLQRLSGRQHQVCTGMCVIGNGKVETFHAVTSVYFKPLNDGEIRAYMQKVYVLDKAGSYAAQECSELIIDKVEGD